MIKRTSPNFIRFYGILKLDWIKKRRSESSGNISKVVFLRGFQRSGTNWVSNLLNLHEDITSKGEFHFGRLFQAIDKYKERPFSVYRSAKDLDVLDKSFQEFIKKLIVEQCNYNKVCIDRTPAPIIRTFIPDVSHIMITRDGRDCVVSWMYHCLRRGINMNNGKLRKYKEIFDNDNQYFEANKHLLLQSPVFVKKISKQWNDHILSDLSIYRDVKNGKIEGDIYWVKYEELLKSTDPIRNNLYEFLGLEGKKSSALDSLTQPGFDEHNPQSHYRKGESGRWKEYFTDEQFQWFMSQAGEALQALGYIE